MENNGCLIRITFMQFNTSADGHMMGRWQFQQNVRLLHLHQQIDHHNVTASCSLADGSVAGSVNCRPELTCITIVKIG